MPTNKRGIILLKEVLYLLLAVAIIAMLLLVASRLYASIIESKEKQQALGTLDNFANFLSDLEEGKSGSFLIYSPKGLNFVIFGVSSKPENVNLPLQCLQKNCVCICDEKCDKKVYCKEIIKPLIGQDFIEINILEIEIENKKEEYFIANLNTEEGKAISSKIETAPGIDVISQYQDLVSAERKDINDVNKIILHHTGSASFESAYKTLKERRLSVHYMVDKDGKIYYFVDEKRRAFHASGMNEESIGIEIVNTGNADDVFTEAQYSSLNKLINDIIKRWPFIKLDNEHIIGHYETSKGIEIGKWDPSPNFDWVKISLPDHKRIELVRVPQEAGYA